MIELKNLSKIFKGKRALNNLNITIPYNSITGIVGPNSAGKTTLLKIIAGFSQTTEGQVTVFGENPYDNLRIKLHTVFVDEHMDYPEKFTIREIFKFMKKAYIHWDQAYAERLLHYFDIDVGAYPDVLSKGKRQVLNATIGLAARASLTILDEPVSGMDIATRKKFYELILKDYLRHPRTILIASHHLNEMENILENMVLLNQGECVFNQPLESLRTYAQAVEGNRSQLDAWSQKHTILYSEVLDERTLLVILENNPALQADMHPNFIYSPVSVTDLIVYLTDQKKGALNYAIYEG